MRGELPIPVFHCWVRFKLCLYSDPTRCAASRKGSHTLPSDDAMLLPLSPPSCFLPFSFILQIYLPFIHSFIYSSDFPSRFLVSVIWFGTKVRTLGFKTGHLTHVTQRFWWLKLSQVDSPLPRLNALTHSYVYKCFSNFSWRSQVLFN